VDVPPTSYNAPYTVTASDADPMVPLAVSPVSVASRYSNCADTWPSPAPAVPVPIMVATLV